jgi:hypothetical protein
MQMTTFRNLSWSQLTIGKTANREGNLDIHSRQLRGATFVENTAVGKTKVLRETGGSGN